MTKKTDSVPEPLRRLLSTYLVVEAVNLESLRRYLQSPRGGEDSRKFRDQLNAAIEANSISPPIYEELTGEDFDTQAELNVWLTKVRDKLYAIS